MPRHTESTVPAQVSRDWGPREQIPGHYLLPNKLKALCTGWGYGRWNWDGAGPSAILLVRTLPRRVNSYQIVEQCTIMEGLSTEATMRYAAR